MKKRSFFNPLHVTLFPFVVLVIVTCIIYYAKINSAQTYNLTAFWAISICWLLLSIAIMLVSYRLVHYFDKTDKFTKKILIAWIAILIFLFVGYSLPIYTALNLIGTPFVEMTLGFYLSLTVLLYNKR